MSCDRALKETKVNGGAWVAVQVTMEGSFKLRQECWEGAAMGACPG